MCLSDLHLTAALNRLLEIEENLFASEIIREKIFLNFKEEIPYSCQVEIEEFKEGRERYDIGAVIYVMREMA